MVILRKISYGSKTEEGSHAIALLASVTECAAILDIYSRLHLIEEIQYVEGRGWLLRVVAMLYSERSKTVNLDRFEYNQDGREARRARARVRARARFSSGSLNGYLEFSTSRSRDAPNSVCIHSIVNF